MAKRGNSFWNSALVVSTLAHAGLLYVLLNHLYQTRVSQPAKASRPIIQASLYKIPSLALTTQQEAKQIQTLEAPKDANLLVEPKRHTSKVTDKPSNLQSNSGSQLPANKPSSAEPAESPTANLKPTERDDIVTQAFKSKRVVQAPVPRTAPPQQPRSAASYLERYQQQQLDKLATQRAKRFEQQKNAPATANPKKHKSSLSAEQQFKQSLEVKVDCSNSAKRAATIAAGLFGGTLRCEPQAELQQFLDAKRQQMFDEEQKRPLRSVVIEP
ncbi:hypothetical protein [Agarivorans albus]|uniref:Uncharacterized protein n=1 Tax=Agarivorans albus MKT 106 TaxID=1331007 RepID=R9PRX9_AGAAL|nr:hypothetical protein [Agarivorans albus]GAD04152.1 hypothetical protein AALB_4232 [Agarivorans albus MKT 106]